MTRVRAAAWPLKRRPPSTFMRTWTEAYLDFGDCNFVRHEYQSIYIYNFVKYKHWFAWYASKGVEQWRYGAFKQVSSSPIEPSR